MNAIAQRLAKLIARAIKVQTGKGPENVAVWLYRDRLTIRATGCLLPLERNLAKNASNHPLLLELRSRFVREDLLGLQELL
ncbi:MAG: Na-translocating system protein MpsC family protein [Bacillota bacterium]|nr:Na-translocating system protein MpsC family protein [Bacillota bacterium]